MNPALTNSTEGLERTQSLAGTIGFIARHPANRKRRIRSLLRFAAWQVWKRTTHRPITTRFRGDLVVRVHPDSRGSSLALYTGLPEYDDMLFVERFVQPGDNVIDVGANIGLYSILAASRSKTGRVIALEPHPLTAERLRENVALNRLSNVEVQAAAAGARSGSAQLTPNLDTINHILVGSTAPNTITVPVVALDDLIDSNSPVAVAKIDAEGFESAVLAGSERLLSTHSVTAWIIEVNGLGARYGYDDRSVIDSLERHGYRGYRYSAETNTLTRSDPPTGEAEWNLIFIADLDAVRARLASSVRQQHPLS